nr:MAG TPA: antitoxin [Caudoviricetes sp.]
MKTYYYTSQTTLYEPYLAHFGVKGMKWGVRRYENTDGTLNAEGKQRVARKYEKEVIKSMIQQQYAKPRIVKDANKRFARNIRARKYDPNADVQEVYNRELTRSHTNYALSNKHYKKARKLVNRYGAENISDVAVENERDLALAKRYINGEFSYKEYDRRTKAKV